MTHESNVALLQAYKDAIETNEDSIAELLKTVILDVMDGERTSSVVIGERKTFEQPWKVEAAPLSVPRSYAVNTTTACTGIDPTKEVVTL